MGDDMHNHDAKALKVTRCLVFGLALVWLAGCYGPSALDRNWGMSVHNNVAQQVLEPEAGLNPKPAVGLPPQAAANEMEGYNKGFSTKEPQQAFVGMQSLSGGQSSGN
jgi:hypothetical protein